MLEPAGTPREVYPLPTGAGVSFGVSRPSSFGGEMNNEKIRQRIEQKIEQLKVKLDSTRNPARRKKLRERKWALKSRLRGD
jgi:hypothetical protein